MLIALVLPTFMYSSIIWAPFQQNRYEELNAVMRKFLQYASYKDKKPMSAWIHDYTWISERCNLRRIETLHEYRDLCFVIEYIKGNLKSEELDRDLIVKTLTYNLRHPRQFIGFKHKSNYIFFAPIFRIVRELNTLPEAIKSYIVNRGAKEKLKS